MPLAAHSHRSTASPFFDLVANNIILNKAASQSTSLYQQCSSLCATLMCVRNFHRYFELAASPGPSEFHLLDPVTLLWDCFALGVPLCYLFNLLPPPVVPLGIDTTSLLHPTDIRTKKRAIAHFAMGVRQINDGGTFTVTDLWDRDSTDGFIKVLNIVSIVIDNLPKDVFLESAPSFPAAISSYVNYSDVSQSPPLLLEDAQDDPGHNVAMEFLHTERKYVQILETLQRYSNTLAQTKTVDHDTVHLLFPGLNKLLNFQRKFLIQLESVFKVHWTRRRWDLCFVDSEDEFAVYEHYCINYLRACEVMLEVAHNLTALDHIVNVKWELPAFLVRPVQRICGYPMLLEALVKALNVEEYQHPKELSAGLAAAKRIASKINEEQRRAENRTIVKDLESRVKDWKGHHLSNFGALVLDGHFIVTKANVDRRYHVFLFEKVMLYCSDVRALGTGKNVSEAKPMIQKNEMPVSLPLSGGGMGLKNTPLVMKGRIFMLNVKRAVAEAAAGQHSLAIYWNGDDDDPEIAILRCRGEAQLRLWERQLTRLIRETASLQTLEKETKLKQNANTSRKVPPNEQGRKSPSVHSMHNDLVEHDSPYFGTSSDVNKQLRKREPGFDLAEDFEATMQNVVSLLPLGQASRIRTDLHLAVEEQDREDAVLNLRGEAAQFALDILQESLEPKQPLTTQGRGARYLRDRRRRLLMKLSLKSDQMPSALFLRGIRCPTRERCRAGGFADIYRGAFGRQTVALKVLRVYEMMEESKKQEIKNAFHHEALLWRTLNHPHILPFLGVDNIVFKNSLSMVLPWLEAGNIRDVMDRRKTKGEPIPLLCQSVHKHLMEIALGLEYLHSESIVHADLRGVNILIDATGAVRLTDFGMAVFANGASNHYASTRGGAIRWLAPELIDNDVFGISSSRPTFASDVYAFSCVCIELYTSRSPFGGDLSDHQVLMRVPMGVRPPRPTFDSVIGMNMPDALWVVVSRCWSHAPGSRPSMEKVTRQMSQINSHLQHLIMVTDAEHAK